MRREIHHPRPSAGAACRESGGPESAEARAD
ncbi:hypothetical protein SUDANB5_06511 [Streptomyces sp. SudanB5_2050]